MDPFRMQYNLPAAIVRCARRGKQVPLFSNALVPEPFVASPMPLSVFSVEWDVPEGQDPNFGAEAFGDGSGRFTRHGYARRCGWGVVALIRQGRSNFLGTAAWGPLPGPLQEVPLSELMALKFFVAHSCPGPDGRLFFYTDCQWVKDTFEGGKYRATHPMSMGAGTWRELFAALDDVLSDHSMLEVIKVAAHASLVACGQDEVLLLHKRGNDEADRRAKLASMVHPMEEEDVTRMKRVDAVQPIVARYLARIGVARLDKFGKDSIPKKEGQEARRGTTGGQAIGVAINATDHRVCIEPATLRVRCSRCMASAELVETLCKYPCKREEEDRGHTIWTVGEFIFCSRCGAHSARRAQGLTHSCHGIPSSTSADYRRKRLLDGKHPTTGAEIGTPRPGVLLDFWHTECTEINEADDCIGPVDDSGFSMA
jgi:hypothetical protein